MVAPFLRSQEGAIHQPKLRLESAERTMGHSLCWITMVDHDALGYEFLFLMELGGNPSGLRLRRGQRRRV